MDRVDQDNRVLETGGKCRSVVSGAVCSSCGMEGIMTLFSFAEMKALQGACVLVPVSARDWQYKDFLSDLDFQVWRDLSDDWQKCLSEKEESPPCETTLCPQRCQIEHCKFQTGMLRKGPRTTRRRGSSGKVHKYEIAV